MAERYVTANSVDLRDAIISRSQAKDFRLYSRLREEAVKRGTQLRIVEDVEYHRLQGTQPEPEPTPERQDDGTVEIDGRRIFPIKRTDAAVLSRYEKFRAVARGLEAELVIVPDNFFSPDGPEAA